MFEPLPIDAAIDEIREALRSTRAAVVVAEPGAGKTTRVPPALIDAGPVVVLQPRRAAARSIAKRIAAERAWTPGREVGWQVRFERNFDSSTRLLIATEGILTARLQQDPFLSDFNTIVIDEFHERSIHADLAVALSRQAMHARTDLRVLVMSATLDADGVSAYLGRCPVITVPGRAHPVAVSYQGNRAVGAAVDDLLGETEGNILCFQPGAFEIERAIREIRSAAPGAEILPLHGSMPAAEQDRALSNTQSRRRVIVCTNIAETSVTVPGVTGVVDSGLEKVARYDADRAIDSLTTERISTAAADQRAGRAGRTAPGLVYRLWDASDRLRPFREPDILRVDLCGPCMDVIAWGGDPRTFDWFEPPRASDVDAALRLLQRLGALRTTTLTEIGRQMHRLALPARLARIVIEGQGDRQVVRAAALLAERHHIPVGSVSTSCDLLTALDGWERLPPGVRQLADQIARVGSHKRQGAAEPHAEGALRQALLAGYPDRVARRREPHSPRFLLASGVGAVLSTDSGVRNAELIVALDLHGSGRAGEPEMRIRAASAVDAEWLTPNDTLEEHYIDERGVVRARIVDCYEAIRLTERSVAPDPDRAAGLLAETWLSKPLPEKDRRLLKRLRFARCDVDLEDLARKAAYGVRDLNSIGLSRVLPVDTVRTLERDAPDSLSLPSGRHARLDYADDGTVSASVKLQELFGLAETPRIGPRREPVLLALLAPNGRPVQMTRDLKSFWDRTYPEVRKELRGRYPRHPWPENPWTATPTARTKPPA